MIHRLTALELATLAALIAVLSLAAAFGAWLIAGLALAFTATAVFGVYAHSAVLRYENELRAAIARLGLNLSGILVELKQNPYLWILIGSACVLMLIGFVWMGVKG